MTNAHRIHTTMGLKEWGLLVALALHLLLRFTGQALPLGGGLWPRFLGMGLLNNAVSFSLIVWGQQNIDSGLAAIPRRIQRLMPPAPI